MKIDQNMVPSIDQFADQLLSGRGGGVGRAEESGSFSDVLALKESEKTAQLPRFSKHAIGRLNSRSINLTQEQLGRLTEGTVRAGAKGINESLVMVDDLAFIVNVRNNTVVTAMDSTRLEESVYTNIDGAVIA